MTTKAQREAWAALEKATTPGVWQDNRALVLERPMHMLIVTEADAAFIADAREAVPALLSEVETLEAANAAARNALFNLCASDNCLSPHLRQEALTNARAILCDGFDPLRWALCAHDILYSDCKDPRCAEWFATERVAIAARRK